MVAGGYADSSIKVWDLQKDHQRIFGTSKVRQKKRLLCMIRTIDTSQQEEAPTARKRTTDYVQLLGHSGPVYACNFSPDNQYLISASEDNTGTLFLHHCPVTTHQEPELFSLARLWSLETRTNLVCYRGHNYPVWDVEFSPLG